VEPALFGLLAGAERHVDVHLALGPVPLGERVDRPVGGERVGGQEREPVPGVRLAGDLERGLGVTGLDGVEVLRHDVGGLFPEC
jgi:hypothetical protein